MGKSDAAIEFLITYGWAILIVLITIGILSYVGFLKPDFSSCVLIPGLDCVDYRVDGTNNQVVLIVENNIGKELSVLSIALADGTCSGASAGIENTLKNGEQATLIIMCPEGQKIAGKNYEGKLSVTYQETGGLGHTLTGTLKARIE